MAPDDHAREGVEEGETWTPGTKEDEEFDEGRGRGDYSGLGKKERGGLSVERPFFLYTARGLTPGPMRLFATFLS
jgi:hypothetical protein